MEPDARGRAVIDGHEDDGCGTVTVARLCHITSGRRPGSGACSRIKHGFEYLQASTRRRGSDPVRARACVSGGDRLGATHRVDLRRAKGPPAAGPPSRTVTRSPSAARRSWPAADVVFVPGMRGRPPAPRRRDPQGLSREPRRSPPIPQRASSARTLSLKTLGRRTSWRLLTGRLAPRFRHRSYSTTSEEPPLQISTATGTSPPAAQDELAVSLDRIKRALDYSAPAGALRLRIPDLRQ